MQYDRICTYKAEKSGHSVNLSNTYTSYTKVESGLQNF